MVPLLRGQGMNQQGKRTEETAWKPLQVDTEMNSEQRQARGEQKRTLANTGTAKERGRVGRHYSKHGES